MAVGFPTAEPSSDAHVSPHAQDIDPNTATDNQELIERKKTVPVLQ